MSETPEKNDAEGGPRRILGASNTVFYTTPIRSHVRGSVDVAMKEAQLPANLDAPKKDAESDEEKE